MGNQQQLSLRWNNYLKDITSVFNSLREENEMVDMTLSCDGKKIRAHKMLLAACSSYFRDLFKENPCSHPVIILKGVRFADLEAVVDLMYSGEVNVDEKSLNSFLQTAELLQIYGLTNCLQDPVLVDSQNSHLTDLGNSNEAPAPVSVTQKPSTFLGPLPNQKSILPPSSSPSSFSSSIPIPSAPLQQPQAQSQVVENLPEIVEDFTVKCEEVDLDDDFDFQPRLVESHTCQLPDLGNSSREPTTFQQSSSDSGPPTKRKKPLLDTTPSPLPSSSCVPGQQSQAQPQELDSHLEIVEDIKHEVVDLEISDAEGRNMDELENIEGGFEETEVSAVNGNGQTEDHENCGIRERLRKRKAMSFAPPESDVESELEPSSDDSLGIMTREVEFQAKNGKRKTSRGRLQRLQVTKESSEDSSEMEELAADPNWEAVGARYVRKTKKKDHEKKETHMPIYYPCHCGMIFKRPKTLLRHQHVHLKEFKKKQALEKKQTRMPIYYPCHCGVKFKTRKSLLRHQHIHSRKRKFGCECGKRFATIGFLTIHKRIHTGERPYTCSFCGKRFMCTSHANQHMRYSCKKGCGIGHAVGVQNAIDSHDEED